MKHTKGEWAYSRTINDYAIYTAEGNSTKDIALVYKDSRAVHWTEAEANAKLIAAAPELLAACQAMMDAPGTGESNTPQARAQRQLAYDKIHKAIQKATT